MFRRALFAMIGIVLLITGCMPQLPRPPAYPSTRNAELTVGKEYCSRLAEATEKRRETHMSWTAALLVLSGLSLGAAVASTVHAAKQEEATSGEINVPVLGYMAFGAFGTIALVELHASDKNRDWRNGALGGLKESSDEAAYHKCLDTLAKD